MLLIKSTTSTASSDSWKQQELAEKAGLLIWKELADGSGLNCLQRATENGAWLTAIPHHLNGTELSWEEFHENIFLWYGIVPLNLPIGCDGCGNKFSVPHDLSCPKGGLVLGRHNYTAKGWGTLSAQAVNPSDISYKPKINIRTVQGEINGAGALVVT